jgi:hypothetical protein
MNCAASRPGQRPGGGRPTGNRAGRGTFKPPANFGFAFGTITKVDGSNLTVKGPFGSSTVVLGKNVAITKTAVVGASSITTKMCAFVRGTSSDGGKTVVAQQVQLSEPVNGSCVGFRPRRP